MSGFQHINRSLLLRYIKEEATPDEKKKVDEWLLDHPEGEQILLQLKQVWEMPAEDKQQWDVKVSWKRYNDRYGPIQDELSRVRHIATRRSPRRHYPWARFGYSIAAGFVLVLIAVFVAINQQEIESPDPGMQEITTGKGERTNLKLSDGSHVILNADSKLQIPSGYGKTSRVLHLEGEAFFEVEHSKEKPFIVYTGNVYTEDLGTSFNIRAYNSDQPVRVVVSEGTVELGSNNSQHLNPSVITARQMGTLDKSGAVKISEVADLSLYLDWVNGRLVFKDRPFDEVREELERWYDIEISVTDSSLNNKRLSAAFENESLTEVLDVISVSLQMNYTHKKRRVVFRPGTPAQPLRIKKP